MTLANDSKIFWTPVAEARFRSKFTVEPDGCWVWQGTVNSKGYGQFSLKNRTLLAHRVAYIWWAGELSADRQLDHLCRNRRCVNPAHLEPVDCKTNLNRGVHAGRERTVCKFGHPLDGRNGQARKCKTCNRERMAARRRGER